jgi:hypothetical protein
MKQLLRFFEVRQFCLSAITGMVIGHTIGICLGKTESVFLLGDMIAVLIWSLRELLEARLREKDAHIERAHRIGQCMRLEAERNLLLKRNRQILGIETELPS